MQGDLHTISHAHPHLHLEIAPQKVNFLCGDCSNQANKQPLIRLISGLIRERGCHVIQAKEDADVDIVKAAVSMASSKTTTLIGEDTDLLVLLLQYTPNNNANKIYVLRSDKGKPNVVYDIKVMKQVLAYEICHSLLFLHAFTGCDATFSIFGLGKKSALYKFKEDSILKTYVWVFSAPNQDPVVIESTGYKVMIALFNAKPGDSLRELRYTILS